MTDEKKPSGQPQAQAAAPQSGGKASSQEPLSRAQEYYRQYYDAESKLVRKRQDAYNTYYKKLAQATTTYQETVREIYEGARKASVPQPDESKSPEQQLQAFKAARAKSLHSAQEVNTQLLNAERKYNQVCGSFWDEIVDSLADAVNDFWDWINGWWEEPPVEGVNPYRHLSDPQWRNALENPAAAYYTGWNYGAKLY